MPIVDNFDDSCGKPQRRLFFCQLSDKLAIDFPDYRFCLFIPASEAIAEFGDLVFVESEGRQFYGYYAPRDGFAQFVRPGITIKARRYNILGVMYPLTSCGCLYTYP